jgi:hypothetical protein
VTKLRELARLVRSKNAGPFVLTFDVMFDSQEKYRRVRDSGVLTPELVSRLYGTHADDVRFFHCESALAIKFSIPRPIASGDLGDGDVFGGQQYAPILDLDIS